MTRGRRRIAAAAAAILLAPPLVIALTALWLDTRFEDGALGRPALCFDPRDLADPRTLTIAPAERDARVVDEIAFGTRWAYEAMPVWQARGWVIGAAYQWFWTPETRERRWLQLRVGLTNCPGRTKR